MASRNKKNRYKPDESGRFSSFFGGFSSGWKRTARWFGIGLLVLVVALVAWDFFRYSYDHPRYQAQLRVEGNEAISENQVRQAVLAEYGADTMPSIHELSSARIHSLLRDEFRRFESVEVHQNLPNELRIVVDEREPVALVARYGPQQDQRYFLPADRSGTLFEPEDHERGTLARQVPVVEGLEEHHPGSREYAEKWERVLAVVDAVQTAFPLDMVGTVSVRDGGFVELMLKRPRPLQVQLGINEYPTKVRQLRELMESAEFQAIEEWINLSDPEQVRVY